MATSPEVAVLRLVVTCLQDHHLAPCFWTNPFVGVLFRLMTLHTFEPGHLLPRTDKFSQKDLFNIDQLLEVWGGSGEDAAHGSQKALEEPEQRCARGAHSQCSYGIGQERVICGQA